MGEGGVGNGGDDDGNSGGGGIGGVIGIGVGVASAATAGDGGGLRQQRTKATPSLPIWALLLPYPNPKRGVERWLKPQLSAFTTAHRMRVACQAALRLERHKTKLEARQLFRSAPNSTTRWVSWRLVDIGEPIRSFDAGHWAHGVRTEPVIGSSAPARKTKNDSPLIFCQTAQRAA